MELLLIGDRIMKPITTKLYDGYVDDPSIKLKKVEAPTFVWKGAKIPYALWAQVVCFLRWTQKEFKEEALVTLFYNTDSDKWAVWVFPQEPNGMAIKLLENDPVYIEDRKMFGAGWITFGSVHHHCNAKAFQSSTDESDELKKDGVHITLGELEDDQLDYDIRQVFDGIQSECTLSQWIEDPQFITNAPQQIKGTLRFVSLLAIKDMPFPDVWKSRVKKPVIHGTETTTSSKERRANKKTIIGSSPELNAWKEKRKLVVIEVCNRLSITPAHAYELITNYPDITWESDDAQMRFQLIRDMDKGGCPMLFAEDLLAEIMEEQKSKPQK